MGEGGVRRGPVEPHPSPLRVDTFPWQGKEGQSLPAGFGSRASITAFIRKLAKRGIPILGLSLLTLFAAIPARAVEPDEMLQDPALEARARAISAGLRCLVCQNQSIDDSAAPLARDLRLIVREHLKAGDTDDEIRRYLVARYGDFVLLKPPFEPATWLLWGTPFAVVLAGGAVLLLRRRSIGTPATLSAEERVRLASLLQDTRGEVH